MTKEQIIAAWKNPALRNSVTPANPAGSVARELDEAELANVAGGCGCGSVCTITGECTCANGWTVCWQQGCF